MRRDELEARPHVMSVRDYWSRTMVCSSCAKIMYWWDDAIQMPDRSAYALGPFLCSAPVAEDGGCDARGEGGVPIRFDWRRWNEAFDYFDGPPAGGGL